MNSEHANKDKQSPLSLVPCRGCTAQCQYIDKCEGKPWRMSDETVSECLAKAVETN